MSSKILIFLFFPLFAYSGTAQQIQTNVATNRPPKSCGQIAYSGQRKLLIDRIESIFLQIQNSNKKTFEAAGLTREEICLKLIRSDRPQAYAKSHNGEIVFSENVLGPEVSDQVIAGVLSHEIAHILLHHNNPGNLPFELRKKLSNDELSLARSYFSLQEDLVTKRLYRGDNLSSVRLRSNHLEQENSKGVRLVHRLLQSPFASKDVRFFVESNLVDEEGYQTILNMYDKGQFVGEKLSNSLESAKRHHEGVNDILSQLDEFESTFHQKGIFIKQGLSQRQLNEKEADELGVKLFLNSGYTDAFAYLYFLKNAYFSEHKNFNSTEDYCSWRETQSPLEMVYSKHPDRICYRLKNLRLLLNDLHKERLLPKLYRDYLLSDKSFDTAQFSLAMSRHCNAAPIKMPNAKALDKVLILTAGHCASISSVETQYNKEVSRTITLKNSYADVGYTVFIDQIIFTTQLGSDLALYELGITYEQLNQNGYFAYELGGQQLQSQQHLKFYSLNLQKESRMLCQLEEIVPNLVEGKRVSKNIYRMALSPRCHFQSGDSGAVGIGKDGKIYGVAQTVFEGGEPCTTDNPCENGDPNLTYPGQVYLSPVDRILTCFDQSTRQFDFDLLDCQIN